MNRPSKDEYYLSIALEVSKRSTCLKRHYGCVIVKNDEIIATGYNGAPRGVFNCCDGGICLRMDKPHNSGDYSDCPSVHAEQNAMISASRRDMINATMYLAGEEAYAQQDFKSQVEKFGSDDWLTIRDCEPCPICKRMIKNSGIKRIVNMNGGVNVKCL